MIYYRRGACLSELNISLNLTGLDDVQLAVILPVFFFTGNESITISDHPVDNLLENEIFEIPIELNSFNIRTKPAVMFQ